MSLSLTVPVITRLETFVFRAPIDEPVTTAFGTMTDRPAVLVRLEDDAGVHGWGEVWCNFPTCGAEHRAHLLATVIAPLLLGRPFAAPEAAYEFLSERTHVLALQSGEPGPLRQVVAGIDIALWDIEARRQDMPLHSALGATAVAPLPVYASGINPTDPAAAVTRARAAGFRAYKLKIGLDRDRDAANLRTVAADLAPGEQLFADANQAWDLGAARRAVDALAELPLGFLEEPLRAGAPAAHWAVLAAMAPFPLAGGENLYADALKAAIAGGALDVIQPDMCKWGGFSGCLQAARAVRASGKRFFPHYLGAGIGLVASAHLLAKAGGDGLLEVDINTNPLREVLAQPFPALHDGLMAVPTGPGLGVEPDLDAARPWLVAHREIDVGGA